ncbi:hypothetical protein BGW39_010795 [Mortierella sp. 14UC]|nr:hypothetical protein BGW39_010795 [Mortierella sp. 14UC]
MGLQVPFSGMIEPSIAEDIQAKAMLRLAEFGRGLSFNPENETIQFWQRFVAKFYGAAGRMRLTLVHTITGDSKIFELVAPSLPRYYLGNTEAGVKEMQLILDSPTGPTSALPLIIEYPSISIVYHYTSGSRVGSIVVGSLKATFTHDLKFDLLEIVSQEFTEYVPRPVDDPSSSPAPEAKPEGKKKGGSKKTAVFSKKAVPMIPESAINEFGISPKTLRLLEVSDMFSKMNELIHYTAQNKRGPAESLASYSQLLREKQALLRAKQMSSSPSITAASAMPMSASASIQGASHIMASNPGGPNPSQLRDSGSPRAVKRRTSVGISPGDTTLRDSPALDDPQTALVAGTGTVLSLQAPALGGAGPSATGLVTGLGLNLISSPIPSPLSAVTSPVFISPNVASAPAAAAPSSAKATKRIRTASATPTLIAATPNGTKGAAANGATTTRNRKGAGRKDSTAKRKASMADIADTIAVPGTLLVGALNMDTGLMPNFSAQSTTGTSSVGNPVRGSTPTGPVLHGPTSQQQQAVHQSSGNHSFGVGVLKGTAVNGAPIFMDGASIPASPMNNHSVSDAHAYFSTGNRPNGAILAEQRNVFQPGTDALQNYGSPLGQEFTGLGNGGLALGMMAGFSQDMPSLQAQAQAHGQMQGHIQVGQHPVQGIGHVQGPLPIGYASGYGGPTGQGLGVNGMLGSMEGMASIPPNATILTSNSGLHSGPG